MASPAAPRAGRRPNDGLSQRAGHALTRLAEGLLLLAVAAAPWAYGGAHETARYTLTAGLLTALTAWGLALARRGAAWPPLALRSAALVALALAQAFLGVSAAPVGTLQAALLLTAFLGVAAFWSEHARAHARAARRLAFAVLLVAGAQALFGAVQHALDPGRIYGHAAAHVTMPFGSYVNHNHFAGLVGLAALLAAGLAWGHARRAGAPTPAAVGFAGLALGLAATQLASRSRGGLLALGGGLVALVALRAVEAGLRREQTRRRGFTAAALLALVIGTGTALALVPARTRDHLLGVLTGAAAADTSSLYRLDVALDTLRLAGRHALTGSGFGAYADAFPAWKRGHGELRTEHAESDVLEVLAEGGLPGLLLIAWTGAFVLGRLRERLARGRDALLNGLTAGAAAALAGLLVHSLFDFNLRLPANALVAASLLGLVAAGRTRHDEHGSRNGDEAVPSASAAPGVVLAVVFALGAGASGWRAAGAWQLERALGLPPPQRVGALDGLLARHPYLAEAWHARGLAWRGLVHTRGSNLAGARLARAERDLEQALRVRPRWSDAWAELGWVRLVRGDGDGARQALDRAVAYDPTHIGVGVTRAAVYARTGDVAAAMHQLARTLEANPAWGVARAVAIAVTWTADFDAYAPLVAGDEARRQLVRQALERHAPPASRP